MVSENVNNVKNSQYNRLLQNISLLKIVKQPMYADSNKSIINEIFPDRLSCDIQWIWGVNTDNFGQILQNIPTNNVYCRIF